MVTLTYVDSGFETSSNFTAHLAAYQALFRELKSFKFLYIAAKDTYFRQAGERFRALVKTPLQSDVSSELLRYFQIRGKWERHEYVVPVADDFEFLNEARKRFHGERFESLYQSWAAGNFSERDLLLEFSQFRPARQVFFGTFLVHQHGSPLAETLRRGDGCVKDTRNPSRHRSRHLRGDAKLLGAWRLRMARRSVWTRAKHPAGLERPHFVATGTVAVAPAQ